MFSNLRVALRPSLFAILLLVASAGTVFADGNYGGTDPPKPPGGGSAIRGITVPVVDSIQDIQTFFSQLRLLIAQLAGVGE